MDPNANLAEQLRIVARLLDEKNQAWDLEGEGERLAELVQALDAWLHNGGFLPERWQR